MNILLDTHVWIWAIERPEKISPIPRELLENRENDIFVSPISTLEIAQLVRSGRIELKYLLSSWVERAMSCLNAGTAPFTHETAEMAYMIPEPFHKDPADRILAATAIVESMYLMTADAKILGCKSIPSINAKDGSLPV